MDHSRFFAAVSRLSGRCTSKHRHGPHIPWPPFADPAGKSEWLSLVANAQDDNIRRESQRLVARMPAVAACRLAVSRAWSYNVDTYGTRLPQWSAVLARLHIDHLPQIESHQSPDVRLLVRATGGRVQTDLDRCVRLVPASWPEPPATLPNRRHEGIVPLYWVTDEIIEIVAYDMTNRLLAAFKSARKGQNQPAGRDAMSELAYPEHEKLRQVAELSQQIGEFLNWLMSERAPRLELAVWDDGRRGHRRLTPSHARIPDLLAEYFDIDQQALEREKRAMLDALRSKQPKGD